MEEKEIKFADKHRKSIFFITKACFLLWSIVLAGSIDKWKSVVVQQYDNVLVYSAFWAFLAGAGVIFTYIFRCKSPEELQKVIELIGATIILPFLLLYILLIFILVIALDINDIGFVTAFICFIGLGFIWSEWKTINKKHHVWRSIVEKFKPD